MAFTHGAATSRAGLASSTSATAPSSDKMEHLLKSCTGQILQEIKSKQSQAGLSVEQSKSLETSIAMLLASKGNENSQGNRDETLLKLVEEKTTMQFELRNLETKHAETLSVLQSERLKAEKLADQVRELQKVIAELKSGDQEDVAKTNELKHQLENVNAKLAQVEMERQFLARDKATLESSITEKASTVSRLQCEVESLQTKSKETRRQLELAESDISSNNTEIRRLKRERESVATERDELQSALKKKTVCLKESEEHVESLESRVHAMKEENVTARRDADVQLSSFRNDIMPKMSAVEAERDELSRSAKVLRSDVDSRDQQITHLKETTALQENKINQMNCEKMAQGVKIDTLHTENVRLTQEMEALLEKMAEQQKEIETLETQARHDASLRRKLHNTIQELKGNIRVFCRVRPLLRKELDSPNGASAREMFEYNELGQGLVAKNPSERRNGAGSLPFKFDKVFDPQCSQSVVFEEISELVQSALDGYRVCIFAYGQTGSGKTHTMLGRHGEDDKHLGMIPRAVRQIFDSARSLAKDGWKFQLSASFLEIYNETIRDLLTENAISKTGKVKEDFKVIFDQASRLSTVPDLTVVTVENEEQVQTLIDRSMKNRATAATKANERSSRSHSVFRLFIEGYNSQTDQRLSGLLNLIDLAGSERLNQSKAEGDRLRETKHINKSLSSLSDVIQSIANKEKHVPFRNSKLTYLLQDSLGGDSKTLMFVNVSHAPESFNESICSLRFATKVNSCQVGTAQRSAKIDLRS